MRTPISPRTRSADGKTNRFLVKGGKTATMAKSAGVFGDDPAIKTKSNTLRTSSKDVVTRNDEVIVEVKRSVSLHARICLPGVTKSKAKAQQRQPQQDRSRKQNQQEEERRQAPPKEKLMDKKDTPMPAAPTVTNNTGLQRPPKDGVLVKNDVTNSATETNDETTKYIPLRQRVREREKKNRDSRVRTHIPKATQLSSDNKVTGHSVRKSKVKNHSSPNNTKAQSREQHKHHHSSCAPPGKVSKSPHQEEGDKDFAKNEGVNDANKAASDGECLDAKASLFSQAANAIMSGAASAYHALTEAGPAKFSPIIPFETNCTDTLMPARVLSCTSGAHDGKDEGQGCCRVEINENEASDEVDCKKTNSNLQHDVSTVGEILHDLDTDLRAERALKDTAQGRQPKAEIVPVSRGKQKPVDQTITTMSSSEKEQQEGDKNGREQYGILEKKDEITSAEVVHLKQAIAAAEAREKLYLSNQRFMEEKLSTLKRELDAERKVVQDREKELKIQTMRVTNRGNLERNISSLQNELEPDRKFVCQDKELKKPRGFFGDFQKKSKTIKKEMTKPTEIEPTRNEAIVQGQGSVYELDLALQSSSHDDASESDMESDGNSSISTATELTGTQGVIGNISLVEAPTATEDDIELELKENECRLEDIGDDSTRSKTDCSSDNLSSHLSSENQSGWLQKILSPRDSEANDESISSSFTNPDSTRGKHAAWKWFRFRSKEIRMSKGGEEADLTSLEDGIYDTSSEYTSEDEARLSRSFDYTLSYDNSASFSVTTPESADIEVQNPLSTSSNSCYETSSELEQNGSQQNVLKKKSN